MSVPAGLEVVGVQNHTERETVEYMIISPPTKGRQWCESEDTEHMPLALLSFIFALQSLVYHPVSVHNNRARVLAVEQKQPKE